MHTPQVSRSRVMWHMLPRPRMGRAEMVAGLLHGIRRGLTVRPTAANLLEMWVMIHVNEYGHCQQIAGEGRSRGTHITIPTVMRSGVVRSASLAGIIKQRQAQGSWGDILGAAEAR